MANRTYPNEWARLIAEIVDRPGWSKAKLARTAGVGKNTPDRWISGESANVSAKSVRLIAEASGIDPQIAASAAVDAQRRQKAEDDDLVRRIMDSDGPDHVKQELIEHVRQRRRETEDALRRDIDLFLRTRAQPET